ncbi:hypothetical protein, partial [Enterobacter kobei]|uniref:hypothetical protein n=1 Tax=Enterobacter kobei TaxID=208224 RepID=UPI001CD1BE83
QRGAGQRYESAVYSAPWISTTFFKNSPESFPARLSRILQLCLWMGWSLISCGFMAQPGLLYCYQQVAAKR